MHVFRLWVPLFFFLSIKPSEQVVNELLTAPWDLLVTRAVEDKPMLIQSDGEVPLNLLRLRKNKNKIEIQVLEQKGWSCKISEVTNPVPSAMEYGDSVRVDNSKPSAKALSVEEGPQSHIIEVKIKRPPAGNQA